MKILPVAVALVLPVASAIAASASEADTMDRLNAARWIHGAERCEDDRDPPIDILRFDEASYILRQNECAHYEAPFIYVLFGEHTVFVQDTGATADAGRFPLYDTVQALVTEWRSAHADRPLGMLVTHSHGHRDHTAADGQFRNRERVTLVEPEAESVRDHFGLARWPEGRATVELGGRDLMILPTPGHDDQSISVYDARTGWLLTGDTFYPGRLSIADWDAYRSSIRRLVAFADTHEISAILGTHMEMSLRPGEDFPAGSTFQPGEANLALTVADLRQLDETLNTLGAEPKSKTLSKFIVSPLGTLERVLGRVLGCFL